MSLPGDTMRASTSPNCCSSAPHTPPDLRQRRPPPPPPPRPDRGHPDHEQPPATRIVLQHLLIGPQPGMAAPPRRPAVLLTDLSQAIKPPPRDRLEGGHQQGL